MIVFTVQYQLIIDNTAELNLSQADSAYTADLQCSAGSSSYSDSDVANRVLNLCQA